MLLIGLTGGIGSGKSSVAKLFREKGLTVIDADLIARDVVKPNAKCWRQVKKYFGEEIIDSKTNEIDRKKLGDIIFNDERKRKLLNSILHPAIYREIFWQCLKSFFKFERFIFIDVPLLYESGNLLKYLTEVIVVYCDRAQQCERIVKRNNLTEDEAMARINAQYPLTEKCKKADCVIDNSRSFDYTKEQVNHLIERLQCDKRFLKLRIIFLSVIVTATFSTFYLTKALFRYFS